MSKFEYTEEMVEEMHTVSANGVTEDIVQSLMEDFGFPRRSVTAKLRKLGFDVPKKQGAAAVFSAEETAALTDILENNNQEKTAEEIASTFADGKFSARQINGKALALDMTGTIKPAEKKVVAKTYTDAEEATVREMAESGKFLEEIADALGKTKNSVRGKLLSMKLKAEQRDKVGAKADAYAGIEDNQDKTIEELAEMFDKTVRGVKTVLTRRGLVAADYTPKASKE